MTRTRAEELARGWVVVGCLLVFVAFALTIDTAKGGRTGVRGGVMLWLVGWLFFGCGGGTLPARKWTLLGGVFVVAGAVLMALSMAWFAFGPIPWVVRQWDVVAAIGLAIDVAALLWAIRLRRGKLTA